MVIILWKDEKEYVSSCYFPTHPHSCGLAYQSYRPESFTVTLKRDMPRSYSQWSHFLIRRKCTFPTNSQALGEEGASSPLPYLMYSIALPLSLLPNRMKFECDLEDNRMPMFQLCSELSYFWKIPHSPSSTLRNQIWVSSHILIFMLFPSPSLLPSLLQHPTFIPHLIPWGNYSLKNTSPVA